MADARGHATVATAKSSHTLLESFLVSMGKTVRCPGGHSLVMIAAVATLPCSEPIGLQPSTDLVARADIRVT